MSGQTTYLISFDQLNSLATLACYLDDSEIIPFDNVRKYVVRDLHTLVERIAGPDARLLYPDPEAA